MKQVVETEWLLKGLSGSYLAGGTFWFDGSAYPITDITEDRGEEWATEIVGEPI